MARDIKTNMMMQVNLGSFGTIDIYHKTRMGSVADVMKIGNEIRLSKGKNKIALSKILRKANFWEFIQSLEKHEINNPDDKLRKPLKGQGSLFDYTCTDSVQVDLDNCKTKKGEIQYDSLINMYPNWITSTNGKGTWAEVYVLLKIAAMLDTDLEVEIYKVFVDSKILVHRGEGGHAFKEFNKILDEKVTELPPKPSRYIKIANLVKDRLDRTRGNGYNEAEHDNWVHENRTKMLDGAIQFINMGYLGSYGMVLKYFETFKLYY